MHFPLTNLKNWNADFFIYILSKLIFRFFSEFSTVFLFFFREKYQKYNISYNTQVEIYNRRGTAPVLVVVNSTGAVLLTKLVPYWRNLGMITPFSNDLQHYYSTSVVLGTSTGPVLVTSTVPVLKDSTGGVLVKYRCSTGRVLAQ